MKHLFTLIAIAFLSVVTSCGVGNYTVVSGKEEKASVCFVDDDDYDISVTIDGERFETRTIQKTAYKSRRNIKKTAKYSLLMTPGRHTVEVYQGDTLLYSKEVFVSTSETKVIEL